VSGAAEPEYPVLIVGGGSVGLALAAELGRLGTRCLLVEQTDGTIDHPRASALNSRTMEFCRRWGIAGKVREVAMPPDFPHTALYLTSFTGYPIARIERPTHGGGDAPLPETSERPQRCNQLWMNPVLRDHVSNLASVTMRTSCRFLAFTQDEDGVGAELHDLATGRRSQVRAHYLVACCGGRSSVLETLGVQMDESSVLSHSINIFIRVKELWTLHDKGKAALNFFVGPDGVWGGMTAQDGRELWRLTVHGSQDEVEFSAADADAAVQRAFGGRFPYEIISAVPWTRRNWVSDRTRFGRVFLAGDSAHQNSPTGGFGLNTGFGDAIDLAWKLTAASAGWAGPHLLDSYQVERRPIAFRNVGAATGNYQRYTLPDTTAIADDTPEGERLRAEVGAGLDRDQRRMVLSDGIALGYRYDPSPIVCLDGTPPPPDDSITYVPSARPGSRAPHGWLADGRSTIDLFGDGFVLLCLGREAAAGAALKRAADSCGMPLQVVSLDEPHIRALYERNFVLVRPDGHVSWRGDALPDDPAGLVDQVRGALELVPVT
jgi:2-polyprenyl-6-methoxyphenol hydroxylase-like FAD-dependent oxidoreductase